MNIDKIKMKELEKKVNESDKLVQELERRREAAKKEIKLLNYKLDK